LLFRRQSLLLAAPDVPKRWGREFQNAPDMRKGGLREFAQSKLQHPKRLGLITQGLH